MKLSIANNFLSITLMFAAHITASAAVDCSGRSDVSPTNIVSSTAARPEDLAPAFEAFRELLGGDNNGNDPNANPSGHRSINWDAGLVPFDMPGDFFANTVTRGLTLQTRDPNDNEFRISNPPADSGTIDDKFSSIIGDELPEQFIQFSPSRLFSPLNDNEIFIQFVDPGNTNVPATVTGFAGVFVDVDWWGSTTMEFFDVDGCLLEREFVPAEPSGLSLLGVDFGDQAIIATVKITLGHIAIGQIDDVLSGGTRGRARSLDVAVMDDFLYGEPRPIQQATNGAQASGWTGKPW